MIVAVGKVALLLSVVDAYAPTMTMKQSTKAASCNRRDALLSGGAFFGAAALLPKPGYALSVDGTNPNIDDFAGSQQSRSQRSGDLQNPNRNNEILTSQQRNQNNPLGGNANQNNNPLRGNEFIASQQGMNNRNQGNEMFGSQQREGARDVLDNVVGSQNNPLRGNNNQNNNPLRGNNQNNNPLVASQRRDARSNVNNRNQGNNPFGSQQRGDNRNNNLFGSQQRGDARNMNRNRGSNSVASNQRRGNKVDINEAMSGDYRRFPGMSSHAAQMIAKNGPYERVSDIFNIQGITDDDRKSFRKYEREMAVLNPMRRSFNDRSSGRNERMDSRDEWMMNTNTRMST